MKKLNIFLMIVLILLIAFVVYFFVGGSLKTQSYAVTAPASDHPDAFQSIKNVLDAHAAPQQFAELSGDAGLYTLVDINIALANHGLFPAEWVDVELENVSGDVAVYSLTGQGSDVPARETSTVNLKLITTAAEGRNYTIHMSYYVHGMKRTITVVA